MATPVRARALRLGDSTPEQAREAIKTLLANEPAATRKVYAGLAHKVWTLLIDRRVDDEVRDWHALVNRVKASIRGKDAVAAEWLVPLADLLRESISFAETSPAREMTRRPNMRRVLDLLHAEGGYVERQAMLSSLGLGSSNLTNILRQLQLHNLIERQGNGKHAAFRLTPFGATMVSAARARKAGPGKTGSRAMPDIVVEDGGFTWTIQAKDSLKDIKTHILWPSADDHGWHGAARAVAAIAAGRPAKVAGGGNADPVDVNHDAMTMYMTDPPLPVKTFRLPRKSRDGVFERHYDRAVPGARSHIVALDF